MANKEQINSEVAKKLKNMVAGFPVEKVTELKTNAEEIIKKKEANTSTNVEIPENEKNKIEIDLLEKEQKEIEAKKKQQSEEIEKFKKEVEILQEKKGAVNEIKEIENISDVEYANFVDKNIVSEETLKNLTGKMIGKEKLSKREEAISVGKMAEINKMIAEKNTKDAAEAILINKNKEEIENLKKNGKYMGMTEKEIAEKTAVLEEQIQGAENQ